MKRKQLKDITVTEVCEIADIKRTTFYRHYKDCFEIAAEFEREQLAVFQTILEEKKKAGEDLLRDILISVDKAIELTGGNGGKMIPESFREGVISTAMKYGMQAWKERIPAVDEREAELVYEGLLAAALRMALSADGGTDRETVVKTIMGLFSAYIGSHCEKKLSGDIAEKEK